MTNTNIQPYPHVEINVKDESIYTPVPSVDLPAFRPLFIIPTQKGPVGEVKWCSEYAVAAQHFGAETFNPLNSTYFTRTALFLNKVFQHSGAFVARVADVAAVKAFTIFELKVEERPDIPHYLEDGTGHRQVDDNGDWIVDSETPVVTGLRLTWIARTTLLGGEEDLESLNIRTTTATETIGGQQVTIPITYYPMIAVEAINPGLWGNDMAFSFYFDEDINTDDLTSRNGGLFFSMAPVLKDYGASTVSAIRDRYNYTKVDFMVKPNVTDTRTTQQVSVDDVIVNRYDETTRPFNLYVYSANFKTLGDDIATLENAGDPEGDEIEDGWYANPFTGMHADGRYYDFVEVMQDGSPTPLVMEQDVYHYLTQGTDGSLDNDDIETLIQQFLALSTNPDIVDQSRYPFNYLFDTGYNIDTKKAILDFLAVRDDVRASMSTQDCSLTVNDAAGDESMGATLREYARLMRESIVMGTEACRASIWAHCGVALDSNGMICPLTLWDAVKHAEYQNTKSLNLEPAGLPNSLVLLFKDGTINWIPSSETTKSTFWSDSINYLAYADMSRIHFPATRSVYPYDTSVLVRNQFVDAIVYAKQRVRESWTKFVDVQQTFEVLKAAIKADLQTSIGELFNGKYAFDINVYQTEEEANLGYVCHVTLTVTAPTQFRVWSVDIVCRRENFEG